MAGKNGDYSMKSQHEEKERRESPKKENPPFPKGEGGVRGGVPSFRLAVWLYPCQLGDQEDGLQG